MKLSDAYPNYAASLAYANFFGKCKRDEKGHCLPKEGGAPSSPAVEEAMASNEERLGQVRADESSRAGDDRPHAVTVLHRNAPAKPRTQGLDVRGQGATIRAEDLK
jgi:hypothetical protein